MDAMQLIHNTVCGVIAGLGFGVFFNIRARTLLWCSVLGGAGLAVRTVALQNELRLEGASFLAAVVVGSAVQAIDVRTGTAKTPLAVAACIPMIPGALAAKAILGLIAATGANFATAEAAFVSALQDGLRVILTIGALGTGLAIPTLLRNSLHDSNAARRGTAG